MRKILRKGGNRMSMRGRGEQEDDLKPKEENKRKKSERKEEEEEMEIKNENCWLQEQKHGREEKGNSKNYMARKQ